MGKLNQSTVYDLCVANECVALLKKAPDLGLILARISPGRVQPATFRDASWANAPEDKSQGSFI
eukprot:15393123-Alexandrium_andersonii.AAC.1